VPSWTPSFILLEVTSEILRRFNIFRLGALVTIGEKNDQHRSSLLKIDPVTRTIVDRQLRNSIPAVPDIYWIAEDEALNPGLERTPWT
jgi:hypothetical protein